MFTVPFKHSFRYNVLPQNLSVILYLVSRLFTKEVKRKVTREKMMINPVAVQYMSKEEIERLMYSFSADKSNDQAQTFEALVRRLLEILEEQSR